MDNFNMAMVSMEPRKMIIILHNNNCLTSCLIIYKHFTGLQKSCSCWQTKCYLCYYHPKIIETILSICYVHTYHLWKLSRPIVAAVSVLNMYVVHDDQLYLNGLDVILYLQCMSWFQWWQGTRGQTTCMLLLMYHTAHNVIHAYLAHD